MGDLAREPEDISIKRDTQTLPSSYPECSVHELEEFHDPFSDISLFLSKRIKAEITTHGSSREWSAQIEQDLLRKILPEFKARFPRHRLGLFALKKAFEKVAYFYEKLYGNQAIKGELDLNQLIRENLCQYLEAGAYPCIKSLAEQIAINVSECVATLEGKKTPIANLMAQIYATLKALLPKVAVQNPFHEYDARDALIVKHQIETIAEHPEITYCQLQAVVEQKLSLLHELPAPHKNAKLETLIACKLGQKWTHTLKTKLCEKELAILGQLVEEEYAAGNPAPKIARHLDVTFVMAKSCYTNEAPSKLLDFYQQEILCEFEESGHSETQKQIERMGNLEQFLTLSSSEAKATIWTLIAQTQPASSPLLSDLVENEIAATIHTGNKQEFWSIVQTTLLSFKKSKEILKVQEGLEEKITFWTLQGELIFTELTLPSPSSRPNATQFLGFHNEFTKREWIFARYDAYKKGEGTPFERYLQLNKNNSNINCCLPLIPQQN